AKHYPHPAELVTSLASRGVLNPALHLGLVNESKPCEHAAHHDSICVILEVKFHDYV
ncbi:Hypothetical predicted protein, partial [Marmota monax]